MMFKTLVDGSIVEMTAEEETEARAAVQSGTRLKRTRRGLDILLNEAQEAEIRAEWAANDIARATRAAAASAAAARVASFIADPDRADLAQRLAAATPAQISNYVDNAVTDLASARALLKRILLVLGTVVKE